MKKISTAIILLVLSNISFAFTATDVANCKSRVTTEYANICVVKQTFPNGSNQGPVCGSTGKTDLYQARDINCPAGKMILFRVHDSYTPNVHHVKLIRNPDDILEDTFVFSIVNESGLSLPSLRSCYKKIPPLQYKSQNLLWGRYTQDWYIEYDEFLTTSATCEGLQTQQTYKVVDNFASGVTTTNVVLNQHVIGVSKKDLANTFPVYLCRNDHDVNKSRYISFSSTCFTGDTSLGLIGYAENP